MKLNLGPYLFLWSEFSNLATSLNEQCDARRDAYITTYGKLMKIPDLKADVHNLVHNRGKPIGLGSPVDLWDDHAMPLWEALSRQASGISTGAWRDLRLRLRTSLWQGTRESIAVPLADAIADRP